MCMCISVSECASIVSLCVCDMCRVCGVVSCVLWRVSLMRVCPQQGTILFTGGGFSLNNMSPYTALGMGKAAQRALAQAYGPSAC